MNNLVSVIIPYYDKRNYFFKCISSALHQTHKNLEIIIVYDSQNKNGTNVEIQQKLVGKQPFACLSPTHLP